MPINTETLNRQLYKRLSKYKPKPLDAEGNVTPIEDEADVFKFTFSKDGEDYGTVFATIDDNHALTIYYSDDVTSSPPGPGAGLDYDDSWTGLLKQLKSWAMHNQLSWNLKDRSRLEGDMARRDHMNKKDKISEGYHAMGKSRSYSDNIPSVKIVIEHSRQIEEGEQRYRNINKIFLENQMGERFLLDTKKPGIARVYARHIAEGGKVNDERWGHIQGLCEEYQKMAGFVRATRNGQFNESAQKLVNEAINHYQSLRESLSKMTGKRGYEAYFESWTPPLMEDETDTSNLNELFVQETLDPRIESVMPILSKLQKNLGEMKEVDELAEWADSLIEGDGESIQSNNPIGIPEGEEVEEVEESALQAYLGDKKYGKDGMDALRKAGQEHASEKKMQNIRAKYSSKEEEVDEGTTVKTSTGIKHHGDYGTEFQPDDARDEYGHRTAPPHVAGSKQRGTSGAGKGRPTHDEKLSTGDLPSDAFSRTSGKIPIGKEGRIHKTSEDVEEDLDANQKRVGQLGPTEKVKNNNIGKLVGANENFIGMAPQAVAEGKGPLGQGDLGLALKSLGGSWSGWHEENSHDPDIEVYDYDDGEGGYYASGSIEHNWKTGEIKVNYHDGEVGADIDETFHSIGDAMNALRGGYPASHGSGKAPNYDTLANKTLAGPDDLYKTDRAGKKGTLSKARMDGMKASSKYTMRGGPQGVLPEGQEDLDAIKRLLGK